MAQRGQAWHSWVRLGSAWLGAARQGRLGKARSGKAGLGGVWLGKAGNINVRNRGHANRIGSAERHADHNDDGKDSQEVL